MLPILALASGFLGYQEPITAKIPPYPPTGEKRTWDVNVDFSVGGNKSGTKFVLSTEGKSEGSITTYPFELRQIEATFNGAKMEYPDSADLEVKYENGLLYAITGTLPILDPQRLVLCCLFIGNDPPVYSAKATTWTFPKLETESSIPSFERTIILESSSKGEEGVLYKLAVKYREAKKSTFKAIGHVWIYESGWIAKSELTLEDFPIPSMGVNVDGKITMSLQKKADKKDFLQTRKL